MLFAGLILRMALAPVIEGHPTDMACFKAWADAASNNLFGFYNNDMFVDYPPAYIYALFFMAKTAKIFGFFSIEWAYTLIIKLPSIISDIIITYLIFRLSEKRTGEKTAFICAGLYLFNPAVILNSTIWGQVDSLFTLLIAAGLILLMTYRFNLSGIFYCAAVLMKPQGIIFLPVLFFDLVKMRNVKSFISTVFSALTAFLIIVLPFSFNQSPLWILKLYINTASGYEGASINAFNLFALLGANWKNDSSILLFFSYKTWGFIFITAITLFTWFLYIKGNNKALPLIASIILITGVFVLSSKMHERYLYPVMALSLMSYAFLKDIRMIWLFVGVSITGFINTYSVFILSLNEIYWVPENDLMLKIISSANILLLVYLIYISIDILVKGNISTLFFNKSYSEE